MKHIIKYLLIVFTAACVYNLVATSNSSDRLLSQSFVFATTQQQEDESSSNGSSGENEKTDTSQESADTEQSENEINNAEGEDSEDQLQVQQPAQMDTISPNVLSVTPNIGTSGISVATTITATFSEPIDASTVTPTTFTLETDNNKVQGSTSVSSDGTTATFTPSSALSGSTIYTATISEVKDLAGNTMNFASPWSFTTEVQASPPSSQTPPPQQPSPSTPSNPGGGSSSGGSGSGGTGDGGSNSGGGAFGDIKTSPSESGVLKDAAQYVEDEKLVDRILPIILSKMDKKQLASTVLPYLDLQVSVRQAQGETKSNEGDTYRPVVTKGSCTADEIIIGGGFQAGGAAKIYYAEIVDNQWVVYALHHPIYDPDTTSSTTASYPICLKAEIVPKDPNAPTLTNGGP